MHFKIFKMIATSGCTTFVFGWGDPAGGAYSALPDLAGLRGPTSKRGRGGEGAGGRERERKVGEGMRQ